MANSISILILAAGASTRMEGKIKQLLPWKKTTLLENAVKQALELTDNINVVLGANADKILKSTTINASIIKNKNWKAGMGSSISCGVKHLLEKEKPEALLITVADQPLIDSAFLQELKQTFAQNESKIVATSYPNGIGVPAIFDCSLYPDLIELRAGFGAKKIIHKHLQFTDLVYPNGKEIDIDTFKEYVQVSEIYS